MKKLFFIILPVIVMCCNCLHAEETNTDRVADKRMKFTVGVLADFNLSGFIHSGVDGAESRMKPGFTAGGLLNMNVNRFFSVQAELLFHYLESDFERGGMNSCYGSWAVGIPVYAMFRYEMRDGGSFYLGAGPYTEFGLSATLEENGTEYDLFKVHRDTEIPPIKSSSTGIAAKAGYEFVCGLQINVTYRTTNNIVDTNSSSVRMRPQMVGIGLAYRFK